MQLSMTKKIASGLLALSVASRLGADVINVPADTPTIQSAIDAASDGDEIIVAPGTYNERIDFSGKAITLRSAVPTAPGVVVATIIDGSGLEGSVVRCANGEGNQTVLNGFVITGGDAPFGGGLYCAGTSPTVLNCSFIGNEGGDGGGIYSAAGAPHVSYCAFTDNYAGNGGGMFNFNGSTATVEHCEFHGNTALEGGGGMRNVSAVPFVSDTRICGNELLQQSVGALSELQGPIADGGGNIVGSFCPPPAAGNPCPADLNGDGAVDGQDLGLLIGAWGGCL